MDNLIYLSKECPFACGEVIFLQSQSNSQIFLSCLFCSTVFESPQEMESGLNLNLSKGIKEFAPEGVVLPTKESIKSSGFGEWIEGVTTNSDLYSIKEINNGL